MMFEETDFGWDLPPGVTQEMCDNAGGQAIDENMPCGCGHPLHEHAGEDDNPFKDAPAGHCTNADCECSKFTEFEPDMDDIDD